MAINRIRSRPNQTIESLLREDRRPGREFNPGVYFDFREKYAPLGSYNSRWLRIVVGKMNAARSFSDEENKAAWDMMRKDFEEAYPDRSIEFLKSMVRKQEEEFERLKNS